MRPVDAPGSRQPLAGSSPALPWTARRVRARGGGPAERRLESRVAIFRAIAHTLTTFLSLISPSCSERRAASSEQPIAGAISRWGRSAT